MYKLVIEDDEGRATELPVVRDEITIGRKEGNTIRLPERNVSRRHAKLYKLEDAIYLEDAGSRYGLKVNGSKVTERIELQPGDHIQIGDYQIALQYEGQAAEPVAPQHIPGDDDDDVDTALIRLEELQGAPAPAPAVAQLLVISSNVPKQSYSLINTETTLGREGEVDILIDHVSMSRQHARIHISKSRYSVVDLDSANGIRVNDKPVGATDLHNGDVVQLGEVKLRFVRRDEQGDLQRAVEEYQHRQDRRISTPAMVGLMLGALALGGVLASLFSGPGGDTDEATAMAPEEPAAADPVEAVAPAAPPVVDFEAEIAEGKRLMEAQDWRAAEKVLAAVLAKDPSNAEIERLRNKARAEALHQQTFTELQDAISRRDFESIDLKLMALPEDSVYRSDADGLADQFRQQRLQYHLDAGNRALQDEKLKRARFQFERALQADGESLDAKRGLMLAKMRLKREEQQQQEEAVAQKEDVEGAEAAATAPNPTAEGSDPAVEDSAATAASPLAAPVPAPEPAEAAPSPTDGAGTEAAAQEGSAAAEAADQPAESEPPPPPKEAVVVAPSKKPPTASSKAVAGRISPSAPPAQKKRGKLSRARQARAYYLEGRKLLRTNPASALKKLKKATKLDPRLPGPHRMLGTYYAEQGKPKRACKHLKTFLRYAPEHPQAQSIRATMAKFGCAN